jgi:hypothetical protein
MAIALAMKVPLTMHAVCSMVAIPMEMMDANVPMQIRVAATVECGRSAPAVICRGFSNIMG